jgi:EAL domain-containing protein (putative c-di-GMP-specific phosphodiesterase class I)
VTEQVLVADMSLAERSLADLAAQGIRIALDDFGAGFCNFRYLKTLPLHYLKLDRSMVDGITEDPRDLAVLRAITAMATALDLEVIAEGIESEPQRLAVAREDVHSIRVLCGAADGAHGHGRAGWLTFKTMVCESIRHPRLRRE